MYGLVGADEQSLWRRFRSAHQAAGRVYFNNHLMNFESAKDAMEHGFAMITEDVRQTDYF